MRALYNSLICRLLPVLATILTAAYANTEIRHFRPSPYTDASADPPLILKALEPHLPRQTILTAPYASTDIETISSLQSTNTTTRQKESWYLLQNLSAGDSYEVRVSYAATTPADFHIDLFSLDTMATMYSVSLERAEAGKQEMQVGGGVAMYARVTAVYSGVSAVAADMQNLPVPYRFVLEKHVLGLPYQALKLIAAIIAVLAVSFFVVVPRVLKLISSALDETKQKSKQE